MRRSLLPAAYQVREHCRKEAGRRQLTEDGNVEITGRDLRDGSRARHTATAIKHTMKQLGLVLACLPMLLAGCGSVVGDASAGPNPGGGFYGAPNIDIGRINP